MKCFFDNCLPRKLAKTLDFLEGDDGITVTHLLEKFSPDISDIESIDILSKEGKWFVITRDNQIKKKPHERKAWQEAQLPIVFLQKSWIQFDFWNIAWRIIKIWSDLTKTVINLKEK
jgi:predicted nuclease of predicted toxin-antitoxin system